MFDDRIALQIIESAIQSHRQKRASKRVSHLQNMPVTQLAAFSKFIDCGILLNRSQYGKQTILWYVILYLLRLISVAGASSSI